MSGFSLFVFIVLLLGSIALAAHHIQKNKRLSARWHQKLVKQDAVAITRLTWARSIQLFLSLGVSCLLVLGYGLNMPQKETQAPITKAQPVIQPQPQPPTMQAAQQAERKSPPQQQTIPQPIATTAPESERKVPPPPTVADIFSPSQSDIDQATKTDALKQRYEDILILYFIMDRCGHTQASDYGWIMNELSKEMRPLGTFPDFPKQILSSAEGSYLELYTKNPCEQKDSPLVTQYRAYIDGISHTQ